MNKELRLGFGPFSKNFLEQIKYQGFVCTKPEILEELYRYSDQASRRLFAGLITESELDKVRLRIVKQVEKLVEIGETK